MVQEMLEVLSLPEPVPRCGEDIGVGTGEDIQEINGLDVDVTMSTKGSAVDRAKICRPECFLICRTFLDCCSSVQTTEPIESECRIKHTTKTDYFQGPDLSPGSYGLVDLVE